MKKWLFLMVAAVVLALGAYYLFVASHVQPLTEKHLTFAEVRLTTMRDIVSATGVVEPREIVLVTTETSGVVMRLEGRVGQLVQEGAELAQLDDRRIKMKLEDAYNGTQVAESAFLQAKAASAQATAGLKQARATYAAALRNLKVQEDFSKNIIGFRSELEQAKSQAEAAEAGVSAALSGVEVADAGVKFAEAKKQTASTAFKEAELIHGMMRIHVPDMRGWSAGHTKREMNPLDLKGQDVQFIGPPKREFLILERKVQEGQLVSPQSGPLFTLAGNLNLVEIHAQVAEGDINKIRKGLSASFNVTTFNDSELEFPGIVKEIRPLASSIKGAVYYATIIEVKNQKDPTTAEWQLRPGMTASVDIIRREHKDVWRVPSTALNFTMEEAYQTDAVKARVAAWKKRADAREWQTLWVWDEASQHPQPVFVRIGGVKNGESGLKDAEGNEVLEWEGKEPANGLRVIIGAPPARPPGFLDQPANVKL